MDCIIGNDRDEADRLLTQILEDGRVEYLGTSDDIEFIEHCSQSIHIHWPRLWLDKLRELWSMLNDG